MKLNFVNPFTRPSRTPLATSTLVGLGTAAILFATSSAGIVVIGVSVGAALSFYGILRLRNRVYDVSDKESAKSAKEAMRAGGRAADSYLEYAKSFLNMDAWLHPQAFGAMMQEGMRQKERKEKEEEEKNRGRNAP